MSIFELAVSLEDAALIIRKDFGLPCGPETIKGIAGEHVEDMGHELAIAGSDISTIAELIGQNVDEQREEEWS
jgi:hypothetical protein